MENKINIAELLKDCPKGMELDCSMYDNVTLDSVDNNEYAAFPIRVLREDGNFITLTKYGQYSDANFAKCVIFPKGKTTWKGCVPPCKFKDGDVVVTGNKYKCVAIFKNAKSFYDDEGFNYYVLIPLYIKEETLRTDDWIDGVDTRLATEEEKQKLFKTIKEHGYKWNAEIKTLDKLAEPKFKVGDNVVRKDGLTIPVLITKVGEYFYFSNTEKSTGFFSIEDQDDWELVPKKFDIATLKPFSEVLVRYDNDNPWMTAHFSHYMKDTEWECPYFASGACFKQCIPYKGNEHLCGTTNDCDDFYKTWK